MYSGSLIRKHHGDAGYDLSATEAFTLEPGEFKTVGTGVHLYLQDNTVALVCPRSGLAAKHGITVLNAPGVIDAGYTGEIQVILINHGKEHVAFEKGSRVAQLVFLEAHHIDSPMPTGVRAENGLGSTGVIG